MKIAFCGDTFGCFYALLPGSQVLVVRVRWSLIKCTESALAMGLWSAGFLAGHHTSWQCGIRSVAWWQEGQGVSWCPRQEPSWPQPVCSKGRFSVFEYGR